MNAVDIRKLNFSYGNIEVFNDLNLQIENGSFCTIIGKGGSGKTTLFRIISGALKANGDVFIFNKSINYNLNKKYLGLVSADIYNFKKEVVIDELMETLKTKRINSEKKKNEIDRISKRIGITKILDSNIRSLSINNRILLLFVIQILSKPKVLILDNVLEYLDVKKNIIIKELLSLNRKSTTVINITNNPNECLYGNDIIILNSYLKYSVNDIEEEIFLKNGLEPPFMISLCSRLKFYNLIHENFFNMEKLVDDLWH